MAVEPEALGIENTHLQLCRCFRDKNGHTMPTNRIPDSYTIRNYVITQMRATFKQPDRLVIIAVNFSIHLEICVKTIFHRK